MYEKHMLAINMSNLFRVTQRTLVYLSVKWECDMGSHPIHHCAVICSCCNLIIKKISDCATCVLVSVV